VTFLQPMILFALPLIGLPLLIHLVNQKRHRTIYWGATRFLLQARRMARGMARLRYWLIMLARMLALAALVFAISRPMAGGWLGFTAGGAPETTLILLDRSVSMESHVPGTQVSRRMSALRKLSDWLEHTGRNTQVVVFDSATLEHRLLESAKDLTDIPQTGPSDTAADVPGLLQRASEYITANQTGRTDIWICSDLQKSDWDATGGRWESFRRQLRQYEGVHIYLLAYTAPPANNMAVSVSGVHRRMTEDGAELLMDICVTRTGEIDKPVELPLGMVIDGARSTLNVLVTGNEFVRSGHAIPLDDESTTGWGRIELPTDANLADNVYRFVYADSTGQNTLVVSENASAGEYLRLAAATAMDSGQVTQADLITPDHVATVDWDQPALVLWQAPLPEGIIARQLQEFVASGRCVLFFPPERPLSATLFGCRWKQWKVSDTAFGIGRWRTETDLFANSRSGFPLPLGELSFYRYCELESERSSVLASLDGGAELLVHTWSDSGAVWFFTSLPEQRSSTLVDNGIAFYVMVQRALARGTTAMGNARQIDCGTVTSSDVADWLPLDEPSRAVFPSTRSTRAGLYSNGEFRMALNRPLSEDSVATIDDDVVKSLFDGLEFTRLNDSVVSSASLASEIWRLFLICMIVALIAESLLSLPRREKNTSQSDLTVGFAETRREPSATVETMS
jgi:hypothetical protein